MTPQRSTVSKDGVIKRQICQLGEALEQRPIRAVVRTASRIRRRSLSVDR
jgi:hypothetical protein